MISEEKKKLIESLSTEEMLFEINLGHKSRFQRDKFAYLKICYQKRVEQNELIKRLDSTNLEDVKQNLRQFKYQNHEVPVVRKWIQEQELKPVQRPPKKKTASKTEKTYNWYEKPLGKIAIAVIGGFLVLALAWIANHYFGLGL